MLRMTLTKNANQSVRVLEITPAQSIHRLEGFVFIDEFTL